MGIAQNSQTHRNGKQADMTRERLAEGDDGSGNRYPVRDEYVCPVGAVVREITAVPEITAARATSERYQVRVWCDGDELSPPFVIHSGSHSYQVRIWHDGDELSLPFVDWQMAMMGAETATRYGTNTSVQLGDEMGMMGDCWYCGKPLTSQSGKPKRRMERGVWHKLHEACAQNWDNESKR